MSFKCFSGEIRHKSQAVSTVCDQDHGCILASRMEKKNTQQPSTIGRCYESGICDALWAKSKAQSCFELVKTTSLQPSGQSARVGTPSVTWAWSKVNFGTCVRSGEEPESGTANWLYVPSHFKVKQGPGMNVDLNT